MSIYCSSLFFLFHVPELLFQRNRFIFTFLNNVDKKRLREELGTIDFMTFKPLRILTPGGCSLELHSYNLPAVSCRTVMMTAGFVTKGQMSELDSLNSATAALCHLSQVTKTPLMPFLSAVLWNPICSQLTEGWGKPQKTN